MSLYAVASDTGEITGRNITVVVGIVSVVAQQYRGGMLADIGIGIGIIVIVMAVGAPLGHAGTITGRLAVITVGQGDWGIVAKDKVVSILPPAS